MNIPLLIGLCMARANAVAGGNAPPSSAPSDVSRTFYSGSKIKATWVNGDSTAYSKVYRSVSGSWVYVGIAEPLEESLETGLTSITTLGVSHYKNGQETAITSEAS